MTYRKPTTTDTTINFFSNHTMEQKVAAFRHRITRMHFLSLTNNRKQKEWTLMQSLARNDNFPQTILHRLNLQIQYKHNHQDHNDEQHKNKSWTTFTYYRPTIIKVSKIFKYTNSGIVFKSTSTLQYFTKPKINDYKHEYDKSGVYNLVCNTSKMSYIGQTSRNLYQR